MSVYEVTSGIVIACVGLVGLVITAVKGNNKRFKNIEEEIHKAKNRHIGCSVEVKTKLEAFEETQRDHGLRLSSVSENVAWLVKWAKNGGNNA